MPDYSRLQILTNGTSITNIDDIRTFLTEIELDENVKAYLESTVNRIENSDYTNKGELLEVLQSKLLETELKENQTELDNQEALRTMTKYNEDLKRINIIQTSKHDNDSKKDIDYITFRRPDGTVEMLATRDAKALSAYLKDHTREATSKTADEIFHYFKEYIYREVEFVTPEQMETVHPEAYERAVVKDDYIRKAELVEVEKYKERYYLPYEVELAVDDEGERIYRLGDGIIKFKDNQGNRQMVILQQPTMTLDNNLETKGSTASGEEPTEETLETPEETIDTTINEQIETANEIRESEMTDLTLEEFREIIYQKEENNRTLTLEEEAKINNFVSMLIGTMVERYASGNIDYELEDTLTDYMNGLIEKYNSVEEGFLPSTAITEEERRLVEQYKEKKQELVNKGLNKTNVKRLELTNQNPDGRPRQGIAALVIILELALVGMYIMMFLSLAK